MRKKEFEELEKMVIAAEDVIDKADYTAHCYFWSRDNGNQKERDRRGEYLSGYAEWTEGGHEWTAEVRIRQSRANTYRWTEYTKDGVTTNLKAARYSFKRMKEVYETEKAKRDARAARKAAREAAKAAAQAGVVA